MRHHGSVSALLLVVLLITGCSRAPAPPPVPRAVRVVVVAPRDAAASSRFTGSLAPWEQVDLAFAVAGKVRSLADVPDGDRRRPIQEGDAVPRGQVLATLDDGDFRLKTRAAAATMLGASAQQSASETALAQATIEVERARKLSAVGAIPAAELERIEANFAAARANVDVARAQRQAASEQNALAQSIVDDTRLLSPIDGVLARRLVDVGESVGPGAAAFTVIETARLRVVFGVPAHQVAAMKIGRKIPVRVEGLATAPLVGTVSKVMPMADPQLRSFSVELLINNPDNTLRPGMVASAGFDGDDVDPVMLIPLEAIVRGPSPVGGIGGFAVWTVAAGTVSLRSVELGDLQGNDVIVAAGLNSGDVVVSRGAQLVRDGEFVEVLP